MLKMMCSQPPCMNIEVMIVRKAGGCFTLSTGTCCSNAARYRAVPWQTGCSCGVPGNASRHCFPGWVIRYGIAPNSTIGFESTS